MNAEVLKEKILNEDDKRESIITDLRVINNNVVRVTVDLSEMDSYDRGMTKKYLLLLIKNLGLHRDNPVYRITRDGVRMTEDGRREHDYRIFFTYDIVDQELEEEEDEDFIISSLDKILEAADKKNERFIKVADIVDAAGGEDKLKEMFKYSNECFDYLNTIQNKLIDKLHEEYDELYTPNSDELIRFCDNILPLDPSESEEIEKLMGPF